MDGIFNRTLDFTTAQDTLTRIKRTSDEKTCYRPAFARVMVDHPTRNIIVVEWDKDIIELLDSPWLDGFNPIIISMGAEGATGRIRI